MPHRPLGQEEPDPFRFAQDAYDPDAYYGYSSNSKQLRDNLNTTTVPRGTVALLEKVLRNHPEATSIYGLIRNYIVHGLVKDLERNHFYQSELTRIMMEEQMLNIKLAMVERINELKEDNLSRVTNIQVKESSRKSVVDEMKSLADELSPGESLDAILKWLDRYE